MLGATVEIGSTWLWRDVARGSCTFILAIVIKRSGIYSNRGDLVSAERRWTDLDKETEL